MIVIFIILISLVYFYMVQSNHKCQDTYNEDYSKLYDMIWYDKKRYKSEVLYISKNVNTQPESVLDLGCGTGNHLNLWKDIWPESVTTGMDLSIDQISKARSKNPGLTLVQGNYLDRKAWGDQSHDIIACMYGAGQYTDQTQKLIENVYNWLKPGGTFIFHGVDPNNICDGCDQTASNTDLPIRSDKFGHCNVLYPNLVYSSWWTSSIFSNWVRYNETFYPAKGVNWPNDWDVSKYVGNNVPLGMKKHSRNRKLTTNGHSMYLLPPSHISTIGRRVGFTKALINPVRGIKQFVDNTQGSEEYFIFFKK